MFCIVTKNDFEVATIFRVYLAYRVIHEECGNYGYINQVVLKKTVTVTGITFLSLSSQRYGSKIHMYQK
jgi:hypothetical protein